MPKAGLMWRAYQLEAISAAIQYYYSNRRKTIIALPTGAGKTIVSGGLIERMLKGVETVLFVVPRKDLVEQTYKKFVTYFFDPADVGMIQGDKHNDLGRRITIASKDTIQKEYRLKKYLQAIGGSVGMLIIDEAQYSMTDKYYMLIERCLGPDGFLLGLSATPMRSDNLSLAPMYPDRVCYFKDTMELIREGALCSFRNANISVEARAEELVPKGIRNRAKVIEKVKKEIRYQVAYDAWYALARDRRTLIFAQNLPDAREFDRFFKSKGVTCAIVTGETKDRDTLYEKFQEGSIPVLINFNVMTTGNDLPEVECILLARPTPYIPMWMQIIGRGLRLCPRIKKKYCQIINITGRQYDMMVFNDLYGIVPADNVDARDVMDEVEKRARRLREEEEELMSAEMARIDIKVKLGEIVARDHDPFIGDGWQADPLLGDVKRAWEYQGNQHQLVAEMSLFSSDLFRPVHIDHRNHRHVLNQQFMPLHMAQRICHLEAIRKEHKLAAKQERERPEHWSEPMNDTQIGYILQRQVPVKPVGWKAGKKVERETKEAILAKLNQGDYQKIVRFLHTYRGWNSRQWHIGTVTVVDTTEHGPQVVFSVQKTGARIEDEMAKQYQNDVQVTISQH